MNGVGEEDWGRERRGRRGEGRKREAIGDQAIAYLTGDPPLTPAPSLSTNTHWLC
ncbi:MAG: hypothetical protein F6J86_36245 [Symploca sp. SIO1B1]|nr:hypothetical protein [Symploca sp. SIO1B1]